MSIHQLHQTTESLTSVVAANVRAEAARRGMSASDLGRALGYSKTVASERWRGVSEWRLNDLARCAEVLGVSVQDLVTDARARRDSNPQPSDLESLAPVIALATWKRRVA